MKCPVCEKGLVAWLHTNQEMYKIVDDCSAIFLYAEDKWECLDCGAIGTIHYGFPEKETVDEHENQ